MKRTLLTVLITALLTALLTTAVLGAGAAWYAGGFFVDFALRRGTAGDPTVDFECGILFTWNILIPLPVDIYSSFEP